MRVLGVRIGNSYSGTVIVAVPESSNGRWEYADGGVGGASLSSELLAMTVAL